MRYRRVLGDTPIIGSYQVSTNPGSAVPVAAPPTNYTTLLVLAALGGVGYLVYRHFHKKGATVSHPSEG